MTFHGYDQDQELQTLKRAKRNRWLGFLFKAILVLAAIFGISLIVLSKIGGSGEQLRLSVEQFFYENTRFSARLVTLNNMQFFPATIVDVEELSLYEEGQTETPAVEIQKARLESSFWDVNFKTGAVRLLNIENVKIAAGVFLPNAINISFLRAEDVRADQAQLATKGDIGGYDFSATSALEVSGEGFQKKYRLGEERRIEGLLADINFFCTLTFPEGSEAKMADLKIKRGGIDVLSGTLIVNFKDEAKKITGDLVFAEHGTRLAPNLTISDGKISGTIKSDTFNTQDFVVAGAFDLFIIDLAKILGYESLLQGDITLDVPGYQGPLQLKDGHVDLSTLPQAVP